MIALVVVAVSGRIAADLGVDVGLDLAHGSRRIADRCGINVVRGTGDLATLMRIAGPEITGALSARLAGIQ